MDIEKVEKKRKRVIVLIVVYILGIISGFLLTLFSGSMLFYKNYNKYSQNQISSNESNYELQIDSEIIDSEITK